MHALLTNCNKNSSKANKKKKWIVYRRKVRLAFFFIHSSVNFLVQNIKDNSKETEYKEKVRIRVCMREPQFVYLAQNQRKGGTFL